MKFLITTNYKYDNLVDPGKNRHKICSTISELSKVPNEKFLRTMCKALAEDGQKAVDTMVPHHMIAVSVEVVAVSQLGEDEETGKEPVNGQG